MPPLLSWTLAYLGIGRGVHCLFPSNFTSHSFSCQLCSSKEKRKKERKREKNHSAGSHDTASLFRGGSLTLPLSFFYYGMVHRNVTTTSEVYSYFLLTSTCLSQAGCVTTTAESFSFYLSFPALTCVIPSHRTALTCVIPSVPYRTISRAVQINIWFL